MSNLIETITNIKGDKYELFQTGKSFKSVVHWVERSNRRATIAANTEERTHRSLSNAMGSNMRSLFQGIWVA